MKPRKFLYTKPQAQQVREYVDEIHMLAGSAPANTRFVVELAEYFQPCEIVLVMRAAAKAGLLAKSPAPAK